MWSISKYFNDALCKSYLLHKIIKNVSGGYIDGYDFGSRHDCHPVSCSLLLYETRMGLIPQPWFLRQLQLAGSTPAHW